MITTKHTNTNKDTKKNKYWDKQNIWKSQHPKKKVTPDKELLGDFQTVSDDHLTDKHEHGHKDKTNFETNKRKSQHQNKFSGGG